MDDNYLQLRVVHEDLPDMIELETSVRHGGWSATSRAYASPDFLIRGARSIMKWMEVPDQPLRLEAGADTGIGWLVMEFYTVNQRGHTACAITLATGGTSRDSRPAETWRFSIELPTELGLIEKFARECLALGENFKGEARLHGLPTDRLP